MIRRGFFGALAAVVAAPKLLLSTLHPRRPFTPSPLYDASGNGNHAYPDGIKRVAVYDRVLIPAERARVEAALWDDSPLPFSPDVDVIF